MDGVGDGIDTRVDIQDLERAKQWLGELRATLLDGLIPRFDEIADRAGSSPDSTPFGGPSVTSRALLRSRHQAYFDAAYDQCTRLADALWDAAEGTRHIMDNYRNAEDRNRATAADIARLMVSIPDRSRPSAGGATGTW